MFIKLADAVSKKNPENRSRKESDDYALEGWS